MFLLFAFFLNVAAFIVNAGLGNVGWMVVNGTMAFILFCTFIYTREDD